MDFKTLLTAGTDADMDMPVLDAAAMLASRWGSHLDVLALGIEYADPALYYGGAAMQQPDYTGARAQAAELAKTFEAKLEGASHPYDVRPYTVPMAGLPSLMEDTGRMADLVVMGRPYTDDRSAACEAVLEAALFAAGAPVLSIPEDQPLPAAFDRVLIAWNESAQALRAVRAAMPILQRAKVVQVLIVDPGRGRLVGVSPGEQLSVMLSRHGVSAEIVLLPSTLARVSDEVARHAVEIGADLVVMGAYGQSRFREMILGGATRELLQSQKTALFLAH